MYLKSNVILSLSAAIGIALYINPAFALNPVVEKKIREGALVVDVRTPAEFASGHFPGSINIPLQEIESRIAEFGEKNRPIVVYCRTGNRSAKAKAILERHGYSDVTNGGGLRDMGVR